MPGPGDPLDPDFDPTYRDLPLTPAPSPDPFAIVPGVNPGDSISSVWGNQVVAELNARDYRAGTIGPSASIGIGAEVAMSVVFSTPMPDANYIPQACEASTNAHDYTVSCGNKTANGFDVRVQNNGSAAYAITMYWMAIAAR